MPWLEKCLRKIHANQSKKTKKPHRFRWSLSSLRQLPGTQGCRQQSRHHDARDTHSTNARELMDAFMRRNPVKAKGASKTTDNKQKCFFHNENLSLATLGVVYRALRVSTMDMFATMDGLKNSQLTSLGSVIFVKLSPVNV